MTPGIVQSKPVPGVPKNYPDAKKLLTTDFIGASFGASKEQSSIGRRLE